MTLAMKVSTWMWCIFLLWVYVGLCCAVVGISLTQAIQVSLILVGLLALMHMLLEWMKHKLGDQIEELNQTIERNNEMRKERDKED